MTHNNNKIGQIERAYQDAINAVDMMTDLLEDLRDSLREINNYTKSPVGGSNTEKGNHEHTGIR